MTHVFPALTFFIMYILSGPLCPTMYGVNAVLLHNEKTPILIQRENPHTNIQIVHESECSVIESYDTFCPSLCLQFLSVHCHLSPTPVTAMKRTFYNSSAL